ncbi:restriction endonuclease subunit S [Streptomyces sp. MBT58]|uniref:restriction endonuclease subunit S n=1 Tax=Streptomyces sp. MBT58 TaxID=1488389 RepID=UPI0022A832FF|nr:restriction endonuclease subunit S [Streptomyces sp. MBT58]
MGPLWKALPEGWRMGQIKNIATVTLGKMLQSKDSGSDSRAPYMRAANVQPDGVLALDDVNEMWFRAGELEQLSIRAGDVVVVEGGQGGFGRAAYVDQDLSGWGFQNSINRLRPRGECDGRFLAFYLIALRASGFIRAYANVVSMPHLTAEKLARVPIPLPPMDQQRDIADYLDRETARIDTLVEEQQRLIKLLKERRGAVVSAAIGTGWSETRLGHVLRGIKDGTHGSFERLPSGEGRPLLGARNVMNGAVVIDGQESFISDSDAASIVANGYPLRGDVLLVIVGATIGKTAVYELDESHAFQRSVAFLRPSDVVNSRFLWHQVQSRRFQDELALRAKTSAQPGIYMGDVVAIPVYVPPIEHQRRIAVDLDHQTVKIDTLIAEAERFIELSKERRSALVTAAVTGQIDVREAA